ncbi:2-oxoglutarate and iron-dependent oxygenase domain-containing protein 2 isoform X1 [Brienomyrus brachyistius]|uniref:2-oxoglutarate and iron-dependent oxygenase domain-containing protein 2 isoform X1 n=2 Tax=Brienomyrus brachyistius TaxID=42636 RepID=UPI0020B2B98C|nr:2-oxoglutarate and iron-dependent oxygenase domain-containing protein 2 isoform X1 [Brienomyrus brachyistius]
MEFYNCSCFYTHNIFVEEYKLHVRFTSKEQFLRDYRDVLRSCGCVTDGDLHAVLQKVESEVDRRRNLCEKSAERTVLIDSVYRAVHGEVYCLQDSFLAPEFLQLVSYACSEGATSRGLLDHMESLAAQRVYRFPVFRKEFCRMLIEELENFERSEAPKGRPNTMNNYGILLNELRFDEGFITPLRERYLQPITQLLYPDCGGRSLDSHKAFVVKYAMGQDLDLSYHYDNAEVTLNVCLGKEFTDGNLYFGDMRQVPLSESECAEVEHRVASGLLHRGQQMHGALRISSGERWNLIVWLRASEQRNRLCPMCDRLPCLEETHGFGDGFTREPPGPDTRTASCLLH